MYSLSVKSIVAKTAFFTFLYVVSIPFVNAAPVLLNNAELDRISAGYVDLEVSARATASGPNAVSRFSANVEQTISDIQPDDYIYTTTTGLASAFARGKVVHTEVGYFLQTDEEILSFSVLQNFSSSKTAARKGKRNKTGNASGKKNKNKKNNLNKQQKKKRQSKKKNKGKREKHNTKRNNKKSGKKKSAAKREKNRTAAQKAKQRKKAARLKKAKLARQKSKRKNAGVVRENRQLMVSIVTRRKAD